MGMNLRHASLLELLAQDEQARFIVSPLSSRRQYVWEATGSGGREVARLWKNLRVNCSEGGKYFCGEILLHELKGREVPTWEIVDGEQRLATIFLLLIALRDVCEKRGVDCSDLHRLLTSGKSSECRLILLATLNHDRHVLDALHRREAASLDKEVQDTSEVYRAYRYFLARIEEEIPFGSQEFLVSILQGIDLAIQTGDHSNPWGVVEVPSPPSKPISPEKPVVAPPITPPIVPSVPKRSEPLVPKQLFIDKGTHRPFLTMTTGIMGCVLVALLCLCAYLWWHDYTRVKTAYYEDVTSHYSVPEGVTELTEDVAQHRTMSYRIESSRYKVRRVTEINGLGFPVDDPIWHHASTQEIHYRDDGNLDFIAYLNRNGREVFRETYRDLLDNTTGGKRYGIDFKFEDPNSPAAPRFYLLSEGTYDRENDVSAKSNVSGVTMDYTADGRPERIRYIDSTGVARPNLQGVFARDFEHDPMAPVTKISNLGPDGKPSADKRGVAATVSTFDALGNQIEVAYFGLEGRPVLNKDGVAKAVFKYDEWGRKIEVDYFGVDGQLVADKAGIAKLTAHYDEHGNVIEQSCYGLDGKPVLNKDGYAGETLKYDERGNVVETDYVGINGEPVSNRESVAKVAARYDRRGNVAETAFFGLDGQPVPNKDGYAGETLKYNADDNVLETAFFDVNGKPVLNNGGYAEVVFKYDDRGNKIEDDFFDVDGHPVLNKSGIAKEAFAYDERGRVIEQLCFGVDGKPVLNGDGVFKLTAKYDDRGNVIETACYGIDGQPTLDRNGLAREIFKYDERDNLIEQSFSGVDGRATLDRNGVARVVFKYDDRGNKIGVDYFDLNGHPVLGNDGFAHETLKYDARGNMIEGAFFGVDGQPKLGGGGFARETLKYDGYDRIIEGNCFGIDGQPIEIGGISRIVYTYDATGNASTVSRFNASGQPVP